MDKKRMKFAAIAAGGLLVIGGGAALASGIGSDPAETSRAIIEGAAEELGVEADELSDALKNAAIEQVEAALAAERITQQQADAMKEAIQSGDGRLLGPGVPRLDIMHRGHPFLDFGLIDAAADYLELTEAQLRSRLADTDSLADLAEAEGKSVDGLVDALVDARRAALDDAVDEGHITESQRDRILEDMKERIEFFVSGALPPWGSGPRHHEFGWGPFGP